MCAETANVNDAGTSVAVIVVEGEVAAFFVAHMRDASLGDCKGRGEVGLDVAVEWSVSWG